jgi:hypothetical protein
MQQTRKFAGYSLFCRHPFPSAQHHSYFGVAARKADWLVILYQLFILGASSGFVKRKLFHQKIGLGQKEVI